MYANIPNSVRKSVYRRDHYTCALCDCSQNLQIHHVIPRGQGGSNSPYNLITLCGQCHAGAHGSPLHDEPFTAADYAQACAEYVGDLYAGDPDFYPLE